MEATFKISKLGEFGLLVEGLESDAGQYLAEDNVTISHRAYRWDHSITINTISYLNSEGLETFKEYKFVNHEVCCADRSELQLDKDGLYRIAHIIIPTKAWIDFAVGLGENFNLYNKVYFYDNGKIYLWNGNSSTEVPFSEFYNEAPSELNTIIRSDKNTFAMYYLNKCFSTLVKDILKDLPACNSTTLDKKVNDRDLIWMFINVIKYCLDTAQLYEAQRFLEKLNKCNTICTDIKPSSNGCGCN